MIDTHAHFNSKDLKNLTEEIKALNQISYLDKVINVGLDYETSGEVIDINLREKKFYGTLGVHPLKNGTIDSILALYRNSNCSKIVAIGETGLDKSNMDDFNGQVKRFIETIELSNFLRLPLVIHYNNANKEVMAILKDHFPKYGFVFHCFQPDLEILDKIVKMGGYISVGTPITRPTAKRSLEVIKEVPIENLLIELDYSYMSMKSKTNGRNGFNRVRTIRGYRYSEMERVLDENAKRLFKKL